MSTTVVSSAPAWTIPDFLEVREGHLAVNGADALELIRKYDSPLFVFSAPRITSNINRLISAARSVEHPVRFFYASKANSNMAVLKTVLGSGIDIEVNSGGELFKALRIGFRPDQIIFNGTSKSAGELDDARIWVCKPRCLLQSLAFRRRKFSTLFGAAYKTLNLSTSAVFISTSARKPPMWNPSPKPFAACGNIWSRFIKRPVTRWNISTSGAAFR